MNKVSEVLKSIKIVKLEEFYGSLQITKQLFSQQVKACEAGETIKLEYYKKAQKELIRIYNLIIDARDEETLDENDERFAPVFKMNLLLKAKSSRSNEQINSYLEELDKLIEYVESRISFVKEEQKVVRKKKVAPNGANELKTAKLKPSDDPKFDDRVQKFLAKPIR